MSPLYLRGGQLLLNSFNGLLRAATNAACCCFPSLCCACDPYISYETLWNTITNHFQYIETTCDVNGVPTAINCGNFDRENATCCTSGCYELWDDLLQCMLNLGLRPEHLNLTPSQLDQKYPGGFCCGGIDSNGFFTNWPDNKNLQIFTVKSTPPDPNIQCVSGGNRELDGRWFSGGVADLITSVALSPGTVTGDMPTPVKTLLESGTNEPCSLPGFYSSLNECRGTYTILLADASFTGQILNASSGDVLSQTSFLLQTSATVSTSLCINDRFGSATLSPYGIPSATDKLCYPLSCQWDGPDLSFDIGYKADITFDDPNSTDPLPEYNTVWNKWHVTVCNGVFSWTPSPNNCVLLPQITNISSTLLFETVGAATGVKIDVDWSPNIKIGNINTECDIVENTSNYCTEQSRSEPSLTITSNGPGSGCTFQPVLTSSINNGLEEWSISSVNIQCSEAGSGYIDDEILNISVATGDTVQQSGILRLKISDNPYLPPLISGVINAANTTPAILSISSTSIGNNRWRIENISSTPGSGYDDGIHPINLIPYSGTITETPATAYAITLRTPPSFSVSMNPTNQGNGGSFTLNDPIASTVNGRQAWYLTFGQNNCTGDGYGIEINNGGTGYTGYTVNDLLEVLAQDEDNYAALPFDPDLDHVIVTLIDGDLDSNYNGPVLSQTSANSWAFNFIVDENGTIIDLPIYYYQFTETSRYYVNTGTIGAYVLNSLNSIENNNNNCNWFGYPSSSIDFMGSYYRMGPSGVPSEVIVDNGGIYYREASPYYIALDGPCLDNINGRIYDPGPCGLENGPAPNSDNTPWSGLYYGNIEEFIYSKSWIYYESILPIPVFAYQDSEPCGGIGSGCYCDANRNYALIVNQREAYKSTNFGYTVAEYGVFWSTCYGNYGVWRTPDLSQYVICPCLNGEYWDYSTYLNIDWWDALPGNNWSPYKIGESNLGFWEGMPMPVTCVSMTIEGNYLKVGEKVISNNLSLLTNVISRCGEYRAPNPPSWPNPSCSPEPSILPE
jgi:hypothetical protein